MDQKEMYNYYCKFYSDYPDYTEFVTAMKKVLGFEQEQIFNKLLDQELFESVIRECIKYVLEGHDVKTAYKMVTDPTFETEEEVKKRKRNVIAKNKQKSNKHVKHQ